MKQIRMLKTVKLPYDCQKNIESFVKNAYQKQKFSKGYYTQATQLLDEALGLNNIQFKKEKSYSANLREIVNLKRIDADFYQPKYVQLIDQLKKFDLNPISQISEKLETGIYSSKYANEGLKYIRGTDIEANGLINEQKLFSTNVVKPTYSTMTQIGDILVTRVGSIGVSGIVLSSEKMLFSDNLIRIRINWKFSDKIIPLYLLLFLKSRYGQMLMTRYSRGSVQQRLNQSQLGEILIPILNLDIQEEISDLLKKSFDCRDQSSILLENAKNEVETLIEEAAHQS